MCLFTYIRDKFSQDFSIQFAELNSNKQQHKNLLNLTRHSKFISSGYLDLFPPGINKTYLFYIPFQNLFFQNLKFRPSGGCEMIPHCKFFFLVPREVEHTSYAFLHLCFFLYNLPVNMLFHFFHIGSLF